MGNICSDGHLGEQLNMSACGGNDMEHLVVLESHARSAPPSNADVTFGSYATPPLPSAVTPCTPWGPTHMYREMIGN